MGRLGAQPPECTDQCASSEPRGEAKIEANSPVLSRMSDLSLRLYNLPSNIKRRNAEKKKKSHSHNSLLISLRVCLTFVLSFKCFHPVHGTKSECCTARPVRVHSYSLKLSPGTCCVPLRDKDPSCRSCSLITLLSCFEFSL